MITFGQKPESIFEKTSLPSAASDLPAMVHVIFVYLHSERAPNPHKLKRRIERESQQDFPMAQISEVTQSLLL